jgi:enoyl-CoA hydratase/carnithine racemase
MKATKRLMNQATAHTVAAAIDAEAQEFVVRLQSLEAKEAFTAFLQKRPPQFNRSSNG